MTSESKRSIRSAAGVLTCLAAIGIGAVLRDRTELRSNSADLDSTRLVASTRMPTDLPETKFFEDIMQLLEQKYVEPISDERKLADGAVRGMVASLGDPNSLFMDPDQYKVYSGVRAGTYEGVGVALVLATDANQGKVQIGADMDESSDDRTLPKLMIACVVPGSSADRAGLKPGDWIEYVDDHWVPNSEAFKRFQEATAKAKKHEMPAAEYLKIRKELQDAAEKNILAIKARDRLMMGSNGVVSTVWNRGGKEIKATLEKGQWTMPGFGVEESGAIRLPFTKGSAEKLRDALAGKTEATLDLRDNFEGDFDTMVQCLNLVAPNGSYGFLVNHRGDQAEPFTVTKGVEKPIKLKLLVDRTTRGAAEIFARALNLKKLATLEGGELGGSPYVVRWTQLASGAGYTLVTSEFRNEAPKGVVASVAGERENPRGETK